MARVPPTANLSGPLRRGLGSLRDFTNVLCPQSSRNLFPKFRAWQYAPCLAFPPWSPKRIKGKPSRSSQPLPAFFLKVTTDFVLEGSRTPPPLVVGELPKLSPPARKELRDNNRRTEVGATFSRPRTQASKSYMVADGELFGPLFGTDSSGELARAPRCLQITPSVSSPALQ